MDTILAGVELLLRWDVLVALFIGSIGGVVIGAIPGVGPAVAIAILLPATYSLEPLVGLVMLLGIYGSSIYGGSLPAILMNTPGTAVNALTTYDGYPMTRRGEAKRAVSLAYSASFIGGILSVSALILFSPVLAVVAPMFGSREIFLAALLGMVLVVLSHRGKVIIAAFMLFFGIFLNSVGLEIVRYSRRYTYDQAWLNSGFDLIIVVLGLFAVSQALLLLTEKSTTPKTPKLEGGVFEGIKEIFKHPRLAGVSSFFGIIMGIVPGVGEFTAQFLSYNYAQKTSKTPEKFGDGSPEGLVASEAANNAVPAAAMIPLLALGIPGEALTAMMLSVFYVHNVIPGPKLFQDNLEFVYALYIALILLNIIVFVFLLGFTKRIVRVIQIPTRFLGMSILTLSFVGIYSVRNSITDCAIAAVFGFLGLIFKRLDIPVVPIVLGMVLGGIMENKFRNALARVDTPLDFVNRPVAAVIASIIVLIVVAHFWSLWRDRQRGRSKS